MKNRRITNMSMTALALLMSSIMASAQAAEILVDSSILDQAMDVIGVKNAEAATVQEEINRLANSTSATFENFKRQNDALEALLVLNAGFRKSVSIQEENIATLDESIASVQSVTREIPLLMEKMLSKNKKLNMRTDLKSFNQFMVKIDLFEPKIWIKRKRIITKFKL